MQRIARERHIVRSAFIGENLKNADIELTAIEPIADDPALDNADLHPDRGLQAGNRPSVDDRPPLVTSSVTPSRMWPLSGSVLSALTASS
ncbi:hypothetical protein [Jiella pacifica]|uniref:hypothetical protein n=1 Tax=Jiella pacifica TaxID=2696469 RepID=UPI0028B0C1A4|nr:hypothetical protein [Jiella pacifica]